MVRPTRLELVRSPTRPSNVRVCLFRQGRKVLYRVESVPLYSTYLLAVCQQIYLGFFKKIKYQLLISVNVRFDYIITSSDDQNKATGIISLIL